MRVKEFDEKIQDDPEFIWFTHSLFSKTLREGKRIEAGANLLRLCRKAYNLGAAKLQADPKPEPEPEVDERKIHGGEASTSISSKGQEDSS